MNNGVISIDYDNCITQAGKLDGMAADCDLRATEAGRIAGTIEAEWQGNSGNAMAAKYREWEKQHRTTATQLREVAQQIRSTAEAIKTADEAAAARIAGEAMMAGAAGAAAGAAGVATGALGAAGTAGAAGLSAAASAAKDLFGKLFK